MREPNRITVNDNALPDACKVWVHDFQGTALADFAADEPISLREIKQLLSPLRDFAFDIDSFPHAVLLS